MEAYPPPKSEMTAEEMLMKLIERAPIIFFREKLMAVSWLKEELSMIQEPEQLRLFEGEA